MWNKSDEEEEIFSDIVIRRGKTEMKSLLCDLQRVGIYVCSDVSAKRATSTFTVTDLG
jgi:hypothetical protein